VYASDEYHLLAGRPFPALAHYDDLPQHENGIGMAAQFAEEVAQRVRRVTAKAWRFAGEMEEIADTFRSAGMPGEFHAAAATVYRRLADFKAARSTPELEDVLAALLRPGA